MAEFVSIGEASARLSSLVAAAERGEVVTIHRDQQAVARIVSIDLPRTPVRPVVGALAGQITIADDFDELSPEWDEYQ